MILKLHRADRVSHAFDGVFDRMCKIVHRIDTPLRPGIVMLRMRDPVKHRVSQIHIRRSHIDLCPKHHLSIRIFPVFHLFKKPQIFLGASVPERTFFPRLRQSAAVFPHLVRIETADKRLALFNQFYGAIIHRFKIVGGKSHLVPVEAQPLYIFHDRFHIFGIFLQRIRIVKSQIAQTVIFLCRRKIETDGFRVPDVKITVRFRRKTRLYRSVIEIILQIFFDNTVDKVDALPRRLFFPGLD